MESMLATYRRIEPLKPIEKDRVSSTIDIYV